MHSCCISSLLKKHEDSGLVQKIFIGTQRDDIIQSLILTIIASKYAGPVLLEGRAQRYSLWFYIQLGDVREYTGMKGYKVICYILCTLGNKIFLVRKDGKHSLTPKEFVVRNDISHLEVTIS